MKTGTVVGRLWSSKRLPELPPGARLFRLAHVAWGVVSMLALGVIWRSVLTGRGGRSRFRSARRSDITISFSS